MTSQRERYDERWFCPLHMDGHQRLAVELSFYRTIDRQDDGRWRAYAPAFGLVAYDENPATADHILATRVQTFLVRQLDQQYGWGKER